MTSSSEATRTRAKRFVPQPDRVAPIVRWMERDYALLEALARFRFLTTTQLVELVGGSRQKVAMRLRQLFHHGFVSRPVVQMDLWREGSEDLVYAIKPKGVRKLVEAGRQESAQLSLSAKDAPKRSAHILHTLGISSFYMALRRHAIEHAIEIDWWPESKALGDRTTIVVQGRKRRFPIFPDAFFRLQPGGAGGLRAFLEIDMGTEPIERGSDGGTTTGADLSKKLRAYWQWGYLEKRHQVHPIYGEHAPRGFVVLIAVNSEQRLQQVLSLTNRQGRGGKLRTHPIPQSEMFWTAVFDPHAKASIYEVDWQTFAGSTRRLV